jgi:phage terminase large subunit
MSNADVWEHLKEEKGVKEDDLIIADSAEPKSIAEFQMHNFNIRDAIKGVDSVRYGIKWLQKLVKIYIDKERCPHTFEEFALYELEKDKNGDFKDKYPDKMNHHIDLVRYSLEDDMDNNYISAIKGLRL